MQCSNICLFLLPKTTDLKNEKGGGGAKHENATESGADITLIQKPNMPIFVFSSALCVY